MSTAAASTGCFGEGARRGRRKTAEECQNTPHSNILHDRHGRDVEEEQPEDTEKSGLVNECTRNQLPDLTAEKGAVRGEYERIKRNAGGLANGCQHDPD